MKIISAEQVARHLPWVTLIDKLDETFRLGVQAPPRHHHSISRADGNATMLLMPAWEDRGYIGVKMLNVFPQNAHKGLPSISGVYLLSDGATGQTLACIDGNELTRRRTAAASALAARYLARNTASTLLIVGTGKVAPMLIEAHAAVRPIQRVLVWGRSKDKAQSVVDAYSGYNRGIRTIEHIQTVDNLEAACAQSDIVSCATLSTSPLLKGEWIKPGTHLDLVGAFRSDMRECDGYTVACSQVFVDTRAGAASEAGDLIQAQTEGHFDINMIRGDLEQLTRREVVARESDQAITLFKSVGASLEDLAAAVVLWETIV
ncbi:ornithine cyclodeaminase family protein [Photobacterium sp. SP02]|uniref:ornithine cyclodeaminase family protein n=1 Tax=Photobacterium sp. SP02 TaxID=3032280 RepID=UPI003144E556